MTINLLSGLAVKSSENIVDSITSVVKKSDKFAPSKSSQPLDSLQIERYNEIVKQDKKYTLRPKKNKNGAHLNTSALPDIQFTISELLQFLKTSLPDKCTFEPPYITGGAACYILSSLDYRDIDITIHIYEESHFPAILQCIIQFIKERSQHPIGDFEILNFYLYRKKLHENRWAYYGLGDIELKFVNKSIDSPTHISTSDSFLIPIVINQPLMAISDSDNFDNAFIALIQKRYIIENPERFKFLFFRIIHKLTQGFEIIIEKQENPFLYALQTLQQDFDFSSLNSFKEKYEAHLEAHYSSEDVQGKFFDLLNFLTVVLNLENVQKRNSIFKAAFAAWLNQQPNKFFKLIFYMHQHAANIADFLDVIKGIYFLEWINEKPTIQRYSISAGKLTSYLAWETEERGRYLYILNTPIQLLETFLCSLNKLEDSFQHNELPLLDNLLNDVAGSKWPLLKKERVNLLSELIETCDKNPFQKLFKDNLANKKDFLGIIKKELAKYPKCPIHDTINNKCAEHLLKLYLEKENKNKDLKELYLLLSNIFAPSQKDLPNILNAVLAVFQKEVSFEKIKTKSELRGLIIFCVKALFTKLDIPRNTDSLRLVSTLLILLQTKLSLSPQEISKLLLPILEPFKEFKCLKEHSLVNFFKFIDEIKEINIDSEVSTFMASLQEHYSPFIKPSLEHFLNHSDFENGIYLILKYLESIQEPDQIYETYNSCLSNLLNQTDCPASVLFNASLAALKIFDNRPIDQVETEKLLKLANKLFFIPKEHLLDGTNKKQIDRLSYYLLKMLASNSTQPSLVQSFVIKLMATTLTSNLKNETIAKRLKELTAIFEFFDNFDLHEGLNSIADDVLTDVCLAIKNLIIFTCKIDLPLAKEIYSKKIIKRYLNEKISLGWHLIKEFSVKNKTEEAFQLWLDETGNLNRSLTSYEIGCSLDLLAASNNLPSEKREAATQNILNLILQDLTNDNDEAVDLTGKILETTQILSSDSSFHSSFLASKLLEKAKALNIISDSDSFKKLKFLISSTINKNQTPSIEIVKEFFDQCFTINENRNHEDDELFFKLAGMLLAEQEANSFKLAWTNICKFISENSWKPHFENYVSEFLKKYDSKIDPFYAQASQIIGLLVKNHLALLSVNFLKDLLTFCMEKRVANHCLNILEGLVLTRSDEDIAVSYMCCLDKCYLIVDSETLHFLERLLLWPNDKLSEPIKLTKVIVITNCLGQMNLQWEKLSMLMKQRIAVFGEKVFSSNSTLFNSQKQQKRKEVCIQILAHYYSDPCQDIKFLIKTFEFIQPNQNKLNKALMIKILKAFKIWDIKKLNDASFLALQNIVVNHLDFVANEDIKKIDYLILTLFEQWMDKKNEKTLEIIFKYMPLLLGRSAAKKPKETLSSFFLLERTILFCTPDKFNFRDIVEFEEIVKNSISKEEFYSAIKNEIKQIYEKIIKSEINIENISQTFKVVIPILDLCEIYAPDIGMVLVVHLVDKLNGNQAENSHAILSKSQQQLFWNKSLSLFMIGLEKKFFDVPSHILEIKVDNEIIEQLYVAFTKIIENNPNLDSLIAAKEYIKIYKKMLQCYRPNADAALHIPFFDLTIFLYRQFLMMDVKHQLNITDSFLDLVFEFLSKIEKETTHKLFEFNNVAILLSSILVDPLLAHAYTSKIVISTKSKEGEIAHIGKRVKIVYAKFRTLGKIGFSTAVEKTLPAPNNECQIPGVINILSGLNNMYFQDLNFILFGYAIEFLSEVSTLEEYGNKIKFLGVIRNKILEKMKTFFEQHTVKDGPSTFVGHLLFLCFHFMHFKVKLNSFIGDEQINAMNYVNELNVLAEKQAPELFKIHGLPRKLNLKDDTYDDV